MTLEVAVIGGGFYGCSIATHLAAQGASVSVFEREAKLLTRASYHNQARLHGGYHYPRSFTTAYRSRYHFARFKRDFAPAVWDTFTKLYAIAKVNSKVSATQFARFCEQIQAPVQVAPAAVQRLFNQRLIDDVFIVEEYAFDAAKLRRQLQDQLHTSGVNVQLETAVREVKATAAGVTLETTSGACTGACSGVWQGDLLINCTYSGLNSIPGIFVSKQRLKHELTELALVDLPAALAELSVTVMDGPFFSFMPFPDRHLSTLTHVRYTPHTAVEEAAELPINPYKQFDDDHPDSAYGFMIRDAARYMPALAEARYADSLFEIKTVLRKNEGDDGRPILFERDPKTPRVLSVLGSKLDNIYDAHAALDAHIDAYELAKEAVYSG
jgi:glycine/D-amino acid oxidase-like deaminating enzyme